MNKENKWLPPQVSFNERRPKAAKQVLLGGVVIGSACIAGMALYNRYTEIVCRRIKESLPDKGLHSYSTAYGAVKYSVSGNGSALLLIHDTASSGMDEFDRADDLTKHFTVYKLDLPGYGESEKIDTSYSSYLYARIISDFVNDVIKQPAHALSSGQSSNALLAAAKLTPELFLSLVMVNPDNSYLKKNRFLCTALAVPVVGSFIYNLTFSLARINKSILRQDGRAIDNETERIFCSVHSGKNKKSAFISRIKGMFVPGVHLLAELPSNTLILRSKLKPHIAEPEVFIDICEKFLLNN